MKQIVDKLVFGSRVAVVAFALLALVVSGAGAAARLFDDPQASTESPERPQNATMDQKPDPEAAPGEMATNGRPCTEQAAYLQATLAVLGGSSQSRSGSDTDQTLASVCDRSTAHGHELLSVSSAMVDHRLGQRFTLLGLKPSGTS
jgi:hypothetical protein